MTVNDQLSSSSSPLPGGEVDLEAGALPGGAVEGDRAAEGLDPVGEADEPGAAPGGGAADAVVADRQVQAAVVGPHVDVGDRRLRVLGGVGQRLGDDVVGGDLDRLGQPRLDVHVELDRDHGAAGGGPLG